MSPKIKKVFLGILIILLVLISFKLYKDKKNNEWSLKITDEMFSGPPAKRTPIKDISLVTTANPNANKDALNLLKYFYVLSNNTKENLILSGQHVGNANNVPEPIADGYQKYFKALEDQTSKLPVLMGADYGSEQLLSDYTEVNKILIDYWRVGGLIEISMHPSNPFTGKGLRDLSLGGHKYEDIFTKVNEVNRRWLADLEKAASGLKQLQDAGVVVLWRPLHEMNGDWFWWSYGENGRVSQEEYIKLWRHMFDYFTKEKGLHNLLWVYAPSATLGNDLIKPAIYYYPGDTYVDITGLDYYWDDMTKVNDNGSYDAMVALGKPFGFTEIGAQSRSGFDNLAIIKAINAKYPQAVFTMHWQGWTNLGFLRTQRAIVENLSAKEFMNDPLVITLDKKVREKKHGSF